MTNDELVKIIEPCHRRIDKKYGDDPSYVIRKRVANTAGDIIKIVSDIPFPELAAEVYFICDEVGFKFFSEKYRNVIEVAKLHPEKLCEQLYKYLRDIGKQIKKDNLLQDFFMFMSIFTEATHISTEHREIFLAYMDLLSEQTEFLRPQFFNHNQLIVGITTENELLTINDPFPNLDLPVYEFIKSRKKGSDGMALLQKLLRKYGYDDREYEEKHSSSGFFTNNINFLIPYINEFTYDMLPKNPYLPRKDVKIIKTNENIPTTDILKARRRTLPANGFLIKFSDSIYLEQALLKEVYYNNSIHLLCKFSTHVGDITVRYNTSNGAFFTPFDYQEGYAAEVHNCLKNISLWLYAAYVCQNEELGILPTEEAYKAFTNDMQATVTFASIGGKPRTTLSSSSGNHLDYDKYEQKSVSIAGYIRKLPEGQKASEEKRLVAQSLGLKLEDDETYVEPFIRRSWKLKIV